MIHKHSSNIRDDEGWAFMRKIWRNSGNKIYRLQEWAKRNLILTRSTIKVRHSRCVTYTNNLFYIILYLYSFSDKNFNQPEDGHSNNGRNM